MADAAGLKEKAQALLLRGVELVSARRLGNGTRAGQSQQQQQQSSAARHRRSPDVLRAILRDERQQWQIEAVSRAADGRDGLCDCGHGEFTVARATSPLMADRD